MIRQAEVNVNFLHHMMPFSLCPPFREGGVWPVTKGDIATLKFIPLDLVELDRLMDGVIFLSSLLNVSEPSVNVCLTGEGVVTHKPGSTASDDVDPLEYI